MIKAAIVGLGRWGQILVDSVEGKSEAIRFVAGATRTPAKAQGFMDAHGIPMAADYGAILKDPKVDAVVLATPHSQHADQVIAGAQAGKHVFVDKPFTLTKASAEVAVAATRKAGVVLALGHNRRFLPAYLELKKRLEAGALGSLFHVEANYSGAGAVDYTPQVWRGSPVESPAGGMAGSGIHMIDGMLGLFGRFRTTTARSLRQALTHDIDDTTFMTFTFDSGLTGYLGALSATPFMWRLQVFGSAGWIELRDETRFEHRRMEGEPEVIEYPFVDTRRVELEAFADAIAGKAAYPIPVEDAIHGVSVFETIPRAAASGVEEPVP